MRILVEECSYDPSVLKGVLPEGRLLLTGDKVKIEHVGYLRSAACDDFVFFLPKVVLEPKKNEETGQTENLVLGKYRPEDLVDLESFKVAEADEETWRRERDFLYEFSVWIYRAIARYERMHSPTDAVWRLATMRRLRRSRTSRNGRSNARFGTRAIRTGGFSPMSDACRPQFPVAAMSP